ncbi:helix-turn-helix transcriptional regulator [Methylobacterium planeticum]|uniref:Helix-turn-helix transcriptional regulator n=1 Tax=Methylobacterium planeticum TaxID=2615211 RepID=A0A6N6MLP3_9HYPH|nr:helix-turn-helix transcriptional regulator [Methylobacterium planeticum]KAB1072172.1 helix-turn-helix transcriptional regulator [Methylobacterium planeticum]
MKAARRLADLLPVSLPPRGLSREEAAAYIGVSPSLFDTMIRDRRMPPPKRINARTVWDRIRLDAAFAALPDESDGASRDVTHDAWGDLAT